MNRITNHQLYRLIAAHFMEIIREPSVIFWGVVFPILMAWGLGIAFTQKGGVQAKLAIVKEIIEKDQNHQTKLIAYLSTNAVKKDSASFQFRPLPLSALAQVSPEALSVTVPSPLSLKSFFP